MYLRTILLEGRVLKGTVGSLYPVKESHIGLKQNTKIMAEATHSRVSGTH